MAVQTVTLVAMHVYLCPIIVKVRLKRTFKFTCSLGFAGFTVQFLFLFQKWNISLENLGFFSKAEIDKIMCSDLCEKWIDFYCKFPLLIFFQFLEIIQLLFI